MKRWIVKKRLFLMIVLLLTGCGGGGEFPEKGEIPGPVAVSAVKAEIVIEPYPLEVPAEVKGVHEATVSARIQGEILEVFASPGDRVGAGEVLARLSTEELFARIRGAEAELRLSELELDRVRNLFGMKAATPQELEIAEARFRSAAAGFDEAQSYGGRATIRSPFDAVVVRRLREAGDLVMPGSEIFRLQGAGGFELVSDLPESLAGFVKKGERVSFVTEHPDISGEALVFEVGPAADSVSRTVRVKARLPEGEFRAGQFGRLVVPGEVEARVEIPATAVFRKGQLEFVYLISGNRAVLRPVRSGRYRGGSVEVTAGLAGGEMVVSAPVSGLREGVAVEILPGLEGR